MRFTGKIGPGAKAQLDKHFGKTKPETPPYVGGTVDKTSAQIKKEKAEEDAKLKKVQEEEKRKALRPAPAQAGHPAIQTTAPPSTYMPPAPPAPEAGVVSNSPKLTLRTIVERSVGVLEVNADELLSGRRAKEKVAACRRVLMYYMLRYAGCTLGAAAVALNLKDHSSAHHARQKMMGLLKYGPIIRRGVANELDVAELVWLKKLCEHFGKELPDSAYWPQEESSPEEQAGAQTRDEQAFAQATAD